MINRAEPTGEVIDSRYGPGDGDVYFVMKDSLHEFTICLKDILECLKFAEEQFEIQPLPESFWFNVYNRYPDMYRGQEYENLQNS